ncbi:MAG: right-handed parallel beta-helix repeat-containing protein [Candidatus Bathyarchaeota archaeon]|nr:right-handed parallel beta-helix repeat-containing protein [Candidatus Bathyarchaeota archaeon]
MVRKLGCILGLVLLLASIGFIIRVQKVEASDTITIQADGTIDGTSKIENVGDMVYTFTDNLNDSIYIERSNIILDGAGYSLNGSASTGVYLLNRENVTVRNINITSFSNGIYLSNSTNCFITENIISDVNRAVFLYLGSNFNIITANRITSEENGIHFWQSSNCTVSNNNITCVRADNNFGIYLYSSSNNNTIRNNVITESQAGIYLYSSSRNNLQGNNITNSGWGQDGGGIWLEQYSDFNSLHENYVAENNWHGIELFKCSNNSVSENNIDSNSNRGIMVQSTSNYNTLTGNNVIGNYKGIEITSSSHHTIINGNNITTNTYEGLILDYAWNNTVSGNNFVSNNVGVMIGGSSDYNNVTDNRIVDSGHAISIIQGSNNNLYRNNLTDNYFGLTIQSSTGNTLRENMMINNTCNFRILGNDLPHFINYVDDSNTVDHKPIYYWIDVHYSIVPEDAACVILVQCTNITVTNMNLSTCNRQGAAIAYSRNITVTDSYIANNDDYAIWLRNSSECYIANNYLKGFIGLQLDYSSNNTFFRNTLTAGGNWGSVNLVESYNNTFYHNNFTDNYIHYLIGDLSSNNWDNGYADGGNYWDNYEQRYPSATDVKSGPYQNETGSDDIWDTPYTLNENNIDNYPIVPEFPSPIILSLLMIAMLLTLTIRKRKNIHIQQTG